MTPALSDDPFTSLEWDKIVVDLEEPLYPFRMTACASKQTDLPQEMFNQCHRRISAQVNLDFLEKKRFLSSTYYISNYLISTDARGKC